MATRFVVELCRLVQRQLIVKVFSLVAVSFAMRRLGPQDFGLTGLSGAFVSISGLIANLGLDQILPKLIFNASTASDKRRIGGEWYSMRMTVNAAMLPVFIIGAILQIKYGNYSPDQAWMIPLIWLGGILQLFGNTLNPQAYSQGVDNVDGFSRAQLFSGMATSIATFLLFVLYSTPAALLLLQALGLLWVARTVFCRENVSIRISVSRESWEILFRSVHKSWPLVLNAFVIFCFGGLEGLFLPIFSSSYEVGIYGAANTLCNGVNAFLTLIPAATLPRILEWQKNSAHVASQRVCLCALLILMLSPLIYFIVYIGASFGVPLLLGSSFKQSVGVLAALVVQYVMYIGYFVLTSLLVARGQYRGSLAISITGAVLGIILYPLAAKYGGAILVAHTKLSVYISMVLVGLFVVKYLGRGKWGMEERMPAEV